MGPLTFSPVRRHWAHFAERLCAHQALANRSKLRTVPACRAPAACQSASCRCPQLLTASQIATPA